MIKIQLFTSKITEEAFLDTRYGISSPADDTIMFFKASLHVDIDLGFLDMGCIYDAPRQT